MIYASVDELKARMRIASGDTADDAAVTNLDAATKDDAAVKTLKIAPAEWDRAVAFRDAEDKAIEDLGCWDRT